MMTRADALATCLANGHSQAICSEIVDSQMVGGTYCDGRIVIDQNGKRCVPRDVIDRVNAARAASPLPSSVAATSGDDGAGGLLLVGVLGLAIVGALVWGAR